MLLLIAALLITDHATFSARGAETNLPAPANGVIDFARDIKPIFENSCYQCHNETRPRSHFRLDTREGALAGGDNGVDIEPGNSAGSPLIVYVAGLDPDIQMPPAGKAAPLTSNQISLLRAWIDQGAAWEDTNPPPIATAELSPFVEHTGVNGDSKKFRELFWQPDGLNAGLEHFELWERTGPDSTFMLSGRISRDDYLIKMEQEKTDFGFIHAGWQQFRKYYSDTGGYDPLLTPSVTSLGRDLHLDVGRGWADFGLTLPDWPRILLGYEYQYRHGDEATLEWGNLNQAGRNLNPASARLQESTHILKLDVDDEIAGTRMADNFRGEFYYLARKSTNEFYSDTYQSPYTDGFGEGYHSFQAANVFRVERDFTDWLFGSAGYLYSKVDAVASVSGNVTDPTGTTLNNNWQSQGITLNREAHVGNLNVLLGPWTGLTFSAGVQGEWSREEGIGNENFINTFQGSVFSQIPVLQLTSLNTSLLEESAAARFSKIPFTSVFADARLRQERVGQNDFQAADAGQFFDPAFALQSHWNTMMYDYRAGFESSPWTWISFGAHYRRYDDDTHYDVFQNEQPPGVPNIGYPGFIHARDLLTDEIETWLVLRLASWVKTTLTYRLLNTDYRTETYPASFGPGLVVSPGGTVPAGESDVNIYSLNATLTPWQRLYVSTTFSFQRSSTVTANNGTAAVEPYRGDTYSVLSTATWVLAKSTDALLTYSFSKADFSQDNFAAGLPQGIRYEEHTVQAGLTRRIGRNVVTKLQYGFAYYDEPSNGGANNFRANSILAMMTLRLP